MNPSNTMDPAKSAAEQIVRALADSLTQAASTVGQRDIGPDWTPPPAVPEPVDGGSGAEPEIERWMVPVLTQVIKIVASAAPGILHDILNQNRDVLGPETRDPEQLTRGFFDVVGAFVPHLLPTVTQIISAFAGRRDAAAPDNDDDLRERWLFPLLGAVLPALLPAVTQVVTSLTQGRGESAVSLTDPNTAPRWIGPVLGGLVSSLTTALPSIISIFTKPQQ
ncbi:hypothetical protein [Actinoplanes aureus]|uniref:Uncharacterized protein n=1 Tax=Actinoplanes aureus TaxID=2792083 RepID=A0A931G500_9ACTN|nr:hypothetical protein [Actinoplanes aureus]MBG0568426.1 hypothetical protein [Actinoplanes aureus]